MGCKLGVILLFALCGLACSAPRPTPAIDAEDLDLKIIAIKHAAARNDVSVAPKLVEYLDSDDPALRLASIQALEKFAGERFGYDYYMDEEQRKPALERWRQWLKEQGNK